MMAGMSWRMMSSTFHLASPTSRKGVCRRTALTFPTAPTFVLAPDPRMSQMKTS